MRCDRVPHNVLKTIGVLLWFTWGWVVWGQTIAVEPLADRTVAPGEFVTLVYRITTSERLLVTAQLTVSTGWLPLRSPGELVLEPGKTNFLSLTVPVPLAASAQSVAMVTLELQSDTARASVSHQLTVSEQVMVTLIAPAEVVLGRETVTASVTNTGNTEIDVRLTLERGLSALSETTITLSPQETRAHTFVPTDEGLYSVVAYQAQTELARRSLRVIRFGVPPPEPLLLRGTLRAEVGTAGYSVTLRGAGQLSDFVSVEGQLSLPDWSESFAALTGPSYLLQLGRIRGRSLGLGVPGYFGVAYQMDFVPYRLLAAGGWVRGQQFAGLVGGALLQNDLEAALIIGIVSGQFFGTSRIQLNYDGSRFEVRTDYSNRVFAVRLRLDTLLESAPFEFRVGLEGLGGRSAALRAAGRWRPERWHVGGDITLPLASEVAADANLEVRSRLITSLPGELSFGVRWGYRRSDLQLSYLTRLSEALQLSQRLTVGWDMGDVYLRSDSQLALTGASFIAVDNSLSYYPGLGRLDGALGVRGRFEYQALTLSGEARWGFPGRQLSLGLSGAYTFDPFTVDLSAGLQNTSESGTSASIRVSGQYAFGVLVSDEVVAALGGRNIGVLQGQVHVAGSGTKGVLIQVGRFQLLTDALGRFEAQLPPGPYTVRLVEGSLAAVYQLISPQEITVEVMPGEVTSVDYLLVERAVIRGRVVLSGGDLTQGVRARLGVQAADGLLRLVTTDENGSFTLRGLPPGPAEVSLLNLPPEYSGVGDMQVTTTLTAGAVTEIAFQVERIQIMSQQFGGQRLRIRQVAPEVERVPPGAAPQITVTLSGEADRVTLMTPTGVVPLSRMDGVWQGRLPVTSAASGIYTFTVIAEAPGETAERSAQLIIDADAPAYSTRLSSPVRPGETLTLSLQSYMALQSIRAEVFGETLELTGDNRSGSWQLRLDIPASAEDAVYPLILKGLRDDGEFFEETLTFRVLVPD